MNISKISLQLKYMKDIYTAIVETKSLRIMFTFILTFNCTEQGYIYNMDISNMIYIKDIYTT